MSVPIIGQATPQQQQALVDSQQKALERIFQGAIEKAGVVMLEEIRGRGMLVNVDSPDNVVLRCGMAAAALFAAESLMAPAVQVMATRMKKLEDELAAAKARLTELERKGPE